jgi:hypothetical protein
VSTFEVTIKMDGQVFWFDDLEETLFKIVGHKDGIAIEDGSGMLHRHRPVQVNEEINLAPRL